MRWVSAVVVAAGLLGGAAYAQDKTVSGTGTSPGAGGWQQDADGPSGRDPGTFIADPTGNSSGNQSLNGHEYGATRGPGANEIQPDRGVVPAVGGQGGKADAQRGHVPTTEQIARGEPPAIQELPPIGHPLEWAPEQAENQPRARGVGKK